MCSGRFDGPIPRRRPKTADNRAISDRLGPKTLGHMRRSPFSLTHTF